MCSHAGPRADTRRTTRSCTPSDAQARPRTLVETPLAGSRSPSSSRAAPTCQRATDRGNHVGRKACGPTRRSAGAVQDPGRRTAMSHSTCPNCGESVATPMMLEPPTTCAKCCARLHTEGALGGAEMTGVAPDPVDLDLDLELVAADSAPRIARQEFRSFATHLGERVSSTAELLISELVTNAVLYGPAAAPTVAVHCSIAGPTLQAEIADDGTGFVPSARPEHSDH